MRTRYIIGIDEVGRGPLAGPVVVAAVCIPATFKLPKHLGSLRDSKQLTAGAREAWARYLKSQPSVRAVLARANPRAIDRLNISRAANLAAQRALAQLAARHGINVARATIVLDGGLYIGSKAEQKKLKNARSMPKADENVPAVAYASILAKVQRDAYMTRQAKRFPAYGFEAHKGYGTLVHRRAIKKHGASPLHRLTFLKAFRTI